MRPRPLLQENSHERLAGNASLVWSRTGEIEAATRSSAGAWSAPAVLASQSSSSAATAIDGAGNVIAMFGSSYSWHLVGGSWRAATSLPAGSSGGLVVADPAGTFVYADSGGNAFTFAAGATSFGVGNGSRGSLGDTHAFPHFIHSFFPHGVIPSPAPSAVTTNRPGAGG
jgi:hypothetical protein